MQKPSIVINLTPRNYKALAALGNRVHAGISGNTLFATPNPALTVLLTAISDLNDAIAQRGDKHSHGSTADVLDLRSKALALFLLLRALADYVENTALVAAGSDYVLMASIISTSGFSLKGAKNPQGLLQPVRNMHRCISRNLGPNKAKIDWTKPENVTSRNNVKCYLLYRGTTTVFSAAQLIGNPVKATYTDINTTGVVQTWTYWVVPVNAAGNGNVSEALTLTLYPV